MGKTVAIVVLAVAAMFSIPVSIAVYQDPNAAADLLNKTGLNNAKNTMTDVITLDSDQIEARIHELVNQERREAGLTSLDYDNSLATIARGHSTNMANNDFYDHVNLQGQDPTARAEASSYFCRNPTPKGIQTGIAENIFLIHFQNSGYSEEGVAQYAVSGWMDSPGHRANILDQYYKAEGLGVAVSGDKILVTQNFC